MKKFLCKYFEKLPTKILHEPLDKFPEKSLEKYSTEILEEFKKKNLNDVIKESLENWIELLEKLSMKSVEKNLKRFLKEFSYN